MSASSSSMIRVVAVCGCFVIAGVPSSAFSWGNFESHPRLTEGGVSRATAVEAHLRDVYGLRAGTRTVFPLLLNLGPITDPIRPDIDGSDMPSGDSRFKRTGNRGLVPFYFKKPADDVWVAPVASCPPGSSGCRYEVIRLLRAGSFGEDNPNRRASHHFHDPVKLHGHPRFNLPNDLAVPEDNRGLDNTQSVWGQILGGSRLSALLTDCCRGGGDFRQAGFSARSRALNLPETPQARIADPPNFFDLPRAEEYLFRALTQPERDVREHFFALHFLAVGSVLHLLQDMTSVAHTRNDFLYDHVANGADLEKAGEHEELVEFTVALGNPAATPDLLLSRPYLALTQTGDQAGYGARLPSFDASGAEFAEFWDSPSRSGLAEVTNANFFSAATVDDRYIDEDSPITAYPLPPVPGCDPPGEKTVAGQRVFVRDLHWRDRDSGKVLDQFSTPFLSSALVPHLARCRMHAIDSDDDVNVSRAGPWNATVVSDTVERDYLELLLPLAIDYSAKFLERYYAPRIEVVPAEAGRFALRNPSDLPIRIPASEIRVFYDDDDENRWSLDLDCGNGATVIEIAPGETSATTCTLPTSLPSGNDPPAVSADFWVVARGAHGERGTSDPNEFETTSFVTFVAHVQPQLLVHGATANEAFADDDPRYPIDVFSIPLDLGHEAAENDVPPTRTNLTAALRASIGSADLDLTSPNGEPHGVRIALRSDKDATEADGLYADVAAPQQAYLFDPTKAPTDPAALRLLPDSEIFAPNGRPHVAPLWSADGAAIFYYEDASFVSQSERVTKDTLLRYRIDDAQQQPFTDRIAFATSNPDETPDDLAVGDQRDVCRGLDDVSARSESVIAGQVWCYTEAVIQQQNGHKSWSQTGPSRTEIRVATVAASIDEQGKLEAQYTERIDVGAGHVISCGGNPNQCWQRGSEPSGQENAREEDVAWSADGTRIAFLRTPTSNPLEFEQEIWVADLVTREVRLVMTSEHGDPGVPLWSPDGKWLVFGMRVGAQVVSTPSGLIVEDGDDIDVYSLRADVDSSQLPQRLTRGLRPFSIGISAPLVLPSAP